VPRPYNGKTTIIMQVLPSPQQCVCEGGVLVECTTLDTACMFGTLVCVCREGGRGIEMVVLSSVHIYV
jgi:hypothetical protein